jgi:hypothetical protein
MAQGGGKPIISSNKLIARRDGGGLLQLDDKK